MEFVGDVATVMESMSEPKGVSIGFDDVVAVSEESDLSNSDASLKGSMNNIGHIGTRMETVSAANETYKIVKRYVYELRPFEKQY